MGDEISQVIPVDTVARPGCMPGRACKPWHPLSFAGMICMGYLPQDSVRDSKDHNVTFRDLLIFVRNLKPNFPEILDGRLANFHISHLVG